MVLQGSGNGGVDVRNSGDAMDPQGGVGNVRAGLSGRVGVAVAPYACSPDCLPRHISGWVTVKTEEAG